MYNNPLIPGDPYMYDVKWIISKILEHSAELSTLDEKIRAEIIAALNQHDPVYFESTDALINSGIKTGALAYIEGYYEPGDGGANLYITTDDYNDIINAAFYITLDGANMWALPVILAPYVTPEMFGAKGDGTTDDSAAIATAIKYGLPLVGNSKHTYYIGNTVNIEGYINTSISGLNILATKDGTITNPVFSINNSNGLTIEKCSFTGGNQVIFLRRNEKINILDNDFIETGYAIIQQQGNYSNDITISGNHAKNITADFVEINSAGSTARRWVISNNTYDNIAPTAQGSATERRFVGITQVDSVVISNNIINNVWGDSAIHIENGIGANVIIDSNIITNSAGTYGSIFIVNMTKNVVISNNIIRFTDLTFMTVQPIYISGQSGTGPWKINIVGNQIFGNGNTQILSFSLTGAQSPNCDLIFASNLCDNFLPFQALRRFRAIGNTFRNMPEFIKTNIDVGKRQLNCSYIANHIDGAIIMDIGSAATTYDDSVIINGNEIYGDVNITNSHNIIMVGNLLHGSTNVFNTSGTYSQNMTQSNNIIVDSGLLP